jgi:hypothetical protein
LEVTIHRVRGVAFGARDPLRGARDPLEKEMLMSQVTLRRHGKIAIASASATTSARRWEMLGPWRTTWINQRIILGYHLGISPDSLAKWYAGSRSRPARQ